MLSELIAWVLNTYLGKYLENFNPAQLSVALLSGEVELENVPIRRDAFRFFSIPVQVLSGCIGKIKLHIPVRQFRTAPWRISIEQLYCVVGPKKLEDWDVLKEECVELDYKLHKLDALEASWRSEKGHQMETYYSTSYNSWLNYGTNLVTNILDNIELKISDVHFRYEDAQTFGSIPIAAGIKISSLTAQSCDSNFVSGTNKGQNSNVSYKLIELNDLSVYWDLLPEGIGCENISNSDLLNYMSKVSMNTSHCFIINPISSKAQWKREKCQQVIRSKDRPRLSCEVLVSEVKISLTDTQYKQILNCLEGLRKINRIRANRLKRPKCSIKENAKSWWIYALNCYGFRFKSEEEKQNLVKDNLRYIRICHRILLNPNENLTKEDKEFKTKMEGKTQLSELKVLKKISFDSIFSKGLLFKSRSNVKGKKMLFHWFPNWMGWYNNNIPTTEQNESLKSIEDDILDALENTMEISAFPKRDTIFGYFKIVIFDAQLILKPETPPNDSPNTSVEMQFKRFSCFVETNPLFTSYTVGISLGTICLIDKVTKNTAFPYIVRPQNDEQPSLIRNYFDFKNLFSKTCNEVEPWLQIQYENVSPSEIRLTAKSKSFDIIYNRDFLKWLLNFFSSPIKKPIFEELESETHKKKTFLKNWKQILIGHKDNHKIWSIDIEVFAPRLIFLDNYHNENSLMVLMDFGKFQMIKNDFRGKPEDCNAKKKLEETDLEKQSEEDEMYMTPCSTPPGSEKSSFESPTTKPVLTLPNNIFINNESELEMAFHNRIYDKYNINLTDLQVLVCKNRESWQASLKSSSNFHLLDKFNISLQIEQRSIFTADPEYPSLTLLGTMPKLLIHANEYKINDFFNIMYPITKDDLFGEWVQKPEEEENVMMTNENDNLSGSLIVVQFVIGQMITEIQSRDKSIAELQILGARGGMIKRSDGAHITLSVHGLLLVDAVQSFGPDFELLVASHRHVGMDSLSGSIRHSATCSPISPGSPISTHSPRPMSPNTIRGAVESIDIGTRGDFPEGDESNALIIVEIDLVSVDKSENPIQINNITFNNLDIIANQQTIMELMDFVRRAIFAHKMFQRDMIQNTITEEPKKPDNMNERHVEIHFDFYRLNILIMHTIQRDDKLVARKVGTLTMTEAKIQATLKSDVSVIGSLGGVQVIDITPDGVNFPRVLSVGKDPRTDPPLPYGLSLLNRLTSEMYGSVYEPNCDELDALNFELYWNKSTSVNIKLRMASVWYTHCPRYLKDINECVTQFQESLRKFIKSVRNKATYMAKELVHQITDVRQPESNKKSKLKNSFDIIINTPVVVLPTSNENKNVFIANLGKINVTNSQEEKVLENSSNATDNVVDKAAHTYVDLYFVDIKNINLFLLKSFERKDLAFTSLPNFNEFSYHKNDSTAILHDTAISIKFSYGLQEIKGTSEVEIVRQLGIEGSFTKALKVSLTRKNYKLLLNSIRSATNFSSEASTLQNLNEGNVLFTGDNQYYSTAKKSINITTNAKFSVPILQIDLQNEFAEAFINILFGEFNVEHTMKGLEKELKISLKSIIMEDLKTEVDSQFRNIFDSSNVSNNLKRESQTSSSWPDLSKLKYAKGHYSGSMPAALDKTTDLGSLCNIKSTKLSSKMILNKHKGDNLVIYKSLTTEEGNTVEEKRQNICSSVEFNCLNLNVSVDKWFAIIDFFDLATTSDSVDKFPVVYHKSEPGSSAVRSALDVRVRSLNVTLIRNSVELSKVNVSNAKITIRKENQLKAVEGCLESIAIYDLSPFGYLYRQKFTTTGSEALSFFYERWSTDKRRMPSDLKTDSSLRINMSSVIYTHTKRFVIELHLFIKEIFQLQKPVMRKLKKTKTEKKMPSHASLMELCIQADSPIIMIPSSYKSNRVLVADLGKFSLVNSFHFASDKRVISKRKDLLSGDEILDVMHIDLDNINLYTAERAPKSHDIYDKRSCGSLINLFNLIDIKKIGKNLFTETCYLKLQIERNTNSDISHNCPDVSVKGSFSKLNGILNTEQYKIIRALLGNNFGEELDDVYHNYTYNLCESIDKLNKINLELSEEMVFDVWKVLSITILLDNVSILLTDQADTKAQDTPIAIINFIKSALEIDLFSDGSQDIDLISSNILVKDARNPPGKYVLNVFQNILQTSQKEKISGNVVQAEIHCRKRLNSAKYTIMLNNMRLIAILDLLEEMKNYLQEEPELAASPQKDLAKVSTYNTAAESQDKGSTEIILNITDSEIILVEDCKRFDSNALILKSTTVFSYKPNYSVNPLSVNINHLEIFSCIMGAEEESALSIIDPFTLNIDLKNNCLHVLIQKQLYIRLSYNDLLLFARMLSVIPHQRKCSGNALQKTNSDLEKVAPLVAMGFEVNDCLKAMQLNNHKLNDAALWLSQQKKISNVNSIFDIRSLSLNANCISICIIDDCLDADVPLLEFTLSSMAMTNRFFDVFLEKKVVERSHCVETTIKSEIRIDYYNRRLSGWEPVMELWEFNSDSKYTKTLLNNNRIDISISSNQLLKLNVTSSLIDLFKMVYHNWTNDYYRNISGSKETNEDNKSTSFRRRSPFVPFALQNFSGAPLLFKPIYAQPGGLPCIEATQKDMLQNWISVAPNETVPFNFDHKSKKRHLNSHKLNLHQILVQIHGWTLIGPISIDKVGVFFRFSTLDSQFMKKTRIIFDISLVGSAQKLITVKSALSIINKTDRLLTVKMKVNDGLKDAPLAITVNHNEEISVPLSYVESSILIKHNTQLNSTADKNALTQKPKEVDETSFSTTEINWKDCINESLQNLVICYDRNKTPIYTLIDISKEKFPHKEANLIGHTITLLPPLKLRNMLCCDLVYKINDQNHGRISPSELINLYNVNIYETFNLSITLDNYQLSGQLKIPMGHVGTVEPKLKLIDVMNRELYLRVSIQSSRGRGMEINICAPVWIINKTGLALVYKQEGTTNPASGQFDEHEKARQVSPLMFSFSDQEGSPALEIRLGRCFGLNNTWCKSFSIHKETIYRELKADNTRGCYVIGINIRRGRGRYASTTFITLAPRFQLYNKTGYKLEFAQLCDVGMHEQPMPSNVISAPIDCSFPFHWPNSDREPLLCVRASDVEYCCWSKGIPINEIQSIYINVRNDWGEMLFLRLEIISRGATYILLFTDGRRLPPPIRIDNYSEVGISFSQLGCEPIWQTNIRPQSSLAYVLDDPLGSPILQIEAPGGNVVEFPINKYEITKSLTYSNFIYIAFRETFAKLDSTNDNTDIFSSCLVLGVRDKKVIVMKQNSGDRSQLWLMNSNGQLEHEGSSPPTYNEKDPARLVLDLEKPPNPTEYTNLVVRPPNKQRITTQTWRFKDGRLMCHANMCVQVRGGLYGLRPGNEAVLGRMESSTRATNSDMIPFEQCISPQKLRPGSGQLEIISKMDGPICAVHIYDIKSEYGDIVLASDPNWDHTSLSRKATNDDTKNTINNEYSIQIKLPKGIGMSIITRKPCEELVYLSFENIDATMLFTPYENLLDLYIHYFQVDNQLLDAVCPVALHTLKTDLEESSQNALCIRIKGMPSPNKNATIFKYFLLDLKPCAVYAEEKFILKIAYFFGIGTTNRENSKANIEHDFNRLEENFLLKNSRRYYFENLCIGPTQVRLSVMTSSKLPYELLETKKSLGLTLVKFEDALIEFDKFLDKHHFETFDIYARAIKCHYINQLKWHAASIIGCVDFLGNPLGFANDLSEGVSGLLFEGSVKSLVKNVTHGISNSTAKLTETLSDSLGKVVLDDHDNETRQKILELQSKTSGGHLAAGLKGFGFGLLGGVTSIIRHTYDGAQNDGVPGFLSGLGKGLVGTVTKPIIGVLDLASETASAVRETSKGSQREAPDRKRLPRCVTGAPGGLLPLYSFRQTKGQQYLYIINRRNYNEKIISYEPNLCYDKEARLRLLVSTEYVRIFSLCDGSPTVMFECHLCEILSCHPLVTSSGASTSTGKNVANFYIEISTNLPKITRPRIRCQSEEVAESASRCINYAKTVYEEREHSLVAY